MKKMNGRRRRNEMRRRMKSGICEQLIYKHCIVVTHFTIVIVVKKRKK